MPLGAFFWIIFVICILFSGFVWYTPTFRYGWAPNVVIWVLIGILGWAVFGPVVTHG
jgi:hypothetical protein